MEIDLNSRSSSGGNLPLVSICCVTYNHVRYISQAIEGFLSQQTDFAFEVIIHDDASTDGTSDIIREYEAKYPTIIKPIYQKVNQFSLGKKITSSLFPVCKGKFIAICEGDDFWADPFKLQKQVDFLTDHPEFSMCFTDAAVIDAEGNFIKHKLSARYKKNLTQEAILSSTTPPTLTVLFRKEAMPKIFPVGFNKIKNGDAFLFALLTFKGEAGYMDFSSAAYRLHNGGVWSGINGLEQIKHRIFTYSTFLESGYVLNKVALIRSINILYKEYINLVKKEKKGILLITILAQNTIFNLRNKNFYFLRLYQNALK